MKSKVFVGIPSLGRPEYITKKTMAWVKDCGFDFKIFVEPHESFLYKHYNGDCIIQLPKSGMKLMYALNHIREYAREQGYKYLFQIDDDVDGFVRMDSKNKCKSFNKTVEDCFQAMEKYSKLGGIRFTQYRFWLYSKKKMYKWTHFNMPLQGVCLVRLEAVPEINPNINVFTDTTTTLFIWGNGYFTLNYGLSGLSVVQNANPGGCQVYDRRDDAMKSVVWLQKYFPEIKEKEGSSWFKVDVDITHYINKNEYKVLNMGDNNLDNFLKQRKLVV